MTFLFKIKDLRGSNFPFQFGTTLHKRQILEFQVGILLLFRFQDSNQRFQDSNEAGTLEQISPTPETVSDRLASRSHAYARGDL